MTQTVGQRELLKEINRLRAFEILEAERVLSRPDLARDTILVGHGAYLAADTGCRLDLTPWLVE